MLKDIILVQRYLSTYYENTKLVMRQQPPSTAKIYSNNSEFKLHNGKVNDE